MINFVIKQNGSTDKKSQFIAETADGRLLATICPRMMQNGKYSGRFMSVCFIDGKVEIADREDGESETTHASELIVAKLFS